MSSFLNRLTFVTSHFSFLIYSSLVWWHIKVVSIYSSSPFRFLMIPLTYFIVCSLTNHCYFWFFQWSCMVLRVGLWRKLSTEKLMLWTVVLEKTLESPLDCKEIQPAHPEGDKSWVFIGRTDAEVEIPILWPPHAKSWLVGKDPDAGRDWGQEEKGTAEDEMAGWHHRLNGHEFE